MIRAGFVLAGGRSSRMGTNKAALPWRGRPLVLHLADAVREAAGSVALIASPDDFPDFPGHVLADLRPGWGPLGGIETALASTTAEWNLVVACDMPLLTADILQLLLGKAESAGAAGLVPEVGGQLQPLAAVYHRRSLPILSEALDAGVRKMGDAVDLLRVVRFVVPAEAERLFANINTPREWQTLLQSEEKGL